MFDRGDCPRSLLHNEMGTLPEGHDPEIIDDLSSRMFYLLPDRLRLYVLWNDSVSAPLYDSTCGRLEGGYIPLFCIITEKWHLCLSLSNYPCSPLPEKSGDPFRRPERVTHGRCSFWSPPRDSAVMQGCSRSLSDWRYPLFIYSHMQKCR